MTLKELGNTQCVLAVALHTQGQRLQALQEEPGVERRCGRTQVTQQLNTCLDDIGERSERLNITNTMIGWVWLNKARETSARRPVKLATINDNTTNRGTMTTNKLRGRVDDDIHPMLKRLDQVRCRQGIIDNNRYTILMGNIRNRLQIQRVQAWIANRLGEDGFSTVINSGTKVIGVAAIHKTHVDTQLR